MILKSVFLFFIQLLNLFYSISLECLLSIFDFFNQFYSPKYKSLKNEVVLITGAGSGVGRLLCLKFAEHSSRVIGVDIDEDGLILTKDIVTKATGQDITILLCDVRFKKNIVSLREIIQKMDLHVDILVNNAGIVHGKRILQLTEEEIEETLAVNVKSNFYTVQEFLPLMLLNDHGHIVFISSIAGTSASARISDYCSSKAAVLLLAESLRCELLYIYGTETINVTVVTPFFIKTDLFNGCKSRFPWILHELEPSYVADKIVKGVMKNQKHLAISRAMYFIPILKDLLPVNALLTLYKFSGGLAFLETFKNIKERKKFLVNVQHESVKVI